MEEQELLLTPLHEEHLKLKARMIPFDGFDMPVQYTGIIEEHFAVREKIGLFDVSHMGEIEIKGKDALPFGDENERWRCKVFSFMLSSRWPGR